MASYTTGFNAARTGVLAEILERRLGNPNIGAVFTDKSYKPKNLGVTV